MMAVNLMVIPVTFPSCRRDMTVDRVLSFIFILGGACLRRACELFGKQGPKSNLRPARCSCPGFRQEASSKARQVDRLCRSSEKVPIRGPCRSALPIFRKGPHPRTVSIGFADLQKRSPWSARPYYSILHFPWE
jgi:hypothetical protein